jgi:hypothetical protein
VTRASKRGDIAMATMPLREIDKVEILTVLDKSSASLSPLMP